jgi:hypothetical protein
MLHLTESFRIHRHSWDRGLSFVILGVPYCSMQR